LADSVKAGLDDAWAQAEIEAKVGREGWREGGRKIARRRKVDVK
jgi:hypothetical protein